MMNRREMLQQSAVVPVAACLELPAVRRGPAKTLEEFEERLKELLGLEGCSAFIFSYSNLHDFSKERGDGLAIDFGFDGEGSAEKSDRAKEIQGRIFAEILKRRQQIAGRR